MTKHPDVTALGARFDQIAPTMMTNLIHGITILAGTYVAVSPWVVGFNDQSAVRVNDLIVGVCVALLAYGYFTAYERSRGQAWVSALLGVWLIVAPWVISGVDRSTGVLLSNIIVGAVIALLGGAATSLEMLRHQRSRHTRT